MGVSLARIKKLESAAALRAKQVAYEPVDMTDFYALLSMNLIAAEHGRLKFPRSILDRYASALRVKPEKLWQLASSKDRRKFRAKHLAFVPPRPADRSQWDKKRLAAEEKRRDALADDVADKIMNLFIEAEVTFQLAEAWIADDPFAERLLGPATTWGLCRYRPAEALSNCITLLFPPGIEVVRAPAKAFRGADHTSAAPATKDRRPDVMPSQTEVACRRSLSGLRCADDFAIGRPGP
jgi:hypothetical protein